MKTSEKIKNNMTAKEKAQKLVEAIARGGHSKELHVRLRDWLFGIPDGGVSEEAFGEWAAENLEPDTSAPSLAEKAKFRKLVELLGIDNQARIVMRKGRSMPWPRIAFRTAAVLVPLMIAAAGALIVYYQSEHKAEKILLCADDPSGRQTFVLPDGSNVTLNNGSTLEYSSDFGSARRVSLDGQALFDITHDSSNPFSVSHGGVSVTVKGTKFHMNAHNTKDRAEVVLISGSVAVQMGSHHKELTPGQKLVLDKKELSVVEHSEAGEGTLLRVSGNGLSIDNMPAVGALSFLADYYGKVLKIEEELGTGSFLNVIFPHDMTVETAIASLNMLSEDAHCRILNDTIYVARK